MLKLNGLPKATYWTYGTGQILTMGLLIYSLCKHYATLLQ